MENWLIYVVIGGGLLIYLGIRFHWFQKIRWPRSGTGSKFWSSAQKNWSVILTVVLLGFLGIWLLARTPGEYITTTSILLVALLLAAIFHSSKWWWAIVLVLGISLYQNWGSWNPLKSNPSSAGKSEQKVLVQTAPKAGNVTLQPGESVLAWLNCRSSHTRVTGGCVEIKSQYFLGTDCPSVATKNWGHVTPGNYKITNWGSNPVSYQWWSD